MSTTPQLLLLARRALVQFPRNPVLLGFSVMPVLMMYLVFGGLFEGVSELPGFPTDNYFEYLAPTAILLATVPGIGNAGVALAADFQSGYFHKLLTTPTSVGTLMLGRLLGDCLRLAVQAALVLLLAVALGAHVETGLLGAMLMIALGTLLGIVTFGALSANLAIRTRDAAAVQAVQPMAFLLIFLTSAYQTTDHIDSAVLRTIIELNPAEHVLRPMRELMLSGYDWGDIATALLVIVGLGLLVLPLTARNYRSAYS
jgi:ABC-2 type transport system permease protein